MVGGVVLLFTLFLWWSLTAFCRLGARFAFLRKLMIDDQLSRKRNQLVDICELLMAIWSLTSQQCRHQPSVKAPDASALVARAADKKESFCTVQWDAVLPNVWANNTSLPLHCATDHYLERTYWCDDPNERCQKTHQIEAEFLSCDISKKSQKHDANYSLYTN